MSSCIKIFMKKYRIKFCNMLALLILFSVFHLLIIARFEELCNNTFTFNFCLLDDEVYMSDTTQMREYLTRQHGIVYVGTQDDPRPRKWYYGQVSAIYNFQKIIKSLTLNVKHC